MTDSLVLAAGAPTGAVEAFAARLTVDLAGKGRHDAPVVLVTRPIHQAAPLVRRLTERGLGAAIVPAIAVELSPPGGALDAALANIDAGQWVAVTSANGARGSVAALDRAGLPLSHVRWAAVGRATAATLRDLGVTDAWVPSQADGITLGDELPLVSGVPVLLARGDLAGEALPRILRSRGASVTDVVAYTTTEAPESSVPMLAAALDRGPQAVILGSASAARGIVALAGRDVVPLTRLIALCIGPGTADAARSSGFSQVREAATRTDDALADLATETLGVPA